MNYKTLITAFALLAVPLVSAEPKAYDTVFYKGKAAGLKFYLSGRDGQMGPNKIRFAPVKGDKAKKEVFLEMDPFGDPPSTVNGTYTVAGKSVPFILKKREKH